VNHLKVGERLLGVRSRVQPYRLIRANALE